VEGALEVDVNNILLPASWTDYL